MSIDPEREPVVYPVVIWLEIAHRLAMHGDGALAAAIHRAMDARRLNDDVAFALTTDERAWVREVLKG